MPEGYEPSVFVSSTCYDLNQVRAELRHFLTGMGLDPVLSETPVFPVSPQINPVENCLRAVRERADIFVLIIGARYGSQNESGKSITNLEYLEAKAKGLPVYVFVLKKILRRLRDWKQNPTADYADVVDTPKIFEFIEELVSPRENRWVFDFDEGIHIIDTLRTQLAYLFMRGLVLVDKVTALNLSEPLAALSGKPLRLLLERPFGWEFHFFSSVLTDELARDQPSKWDLQYGLKLASPRTLGDMGALFIWIAQKYDEILALTDSFSQLLNKVIQDALGRPGQSGDPEHLLYVAKRLARLRKAVIEWAIDFNCTKTRPECERVLNLIAAASGVIIQTIESIPAVVDAEINKAIEAHGRGEVYEAKMMFTLSEMPNSAEIQVEFEKLSRLIELETDEFRS
jgi:hypothetical protein